eukprot:g1215.t1
MQHAIGRRGITIISSLSVGVMKNRQLSGCTGLILGCLGALRVSAFCTSESKNLNSSECQAWVDIYDALGGAAWTETCDKPDPCKCEKVTTCNGNKTHITNIRLVSVNASGTLPTEAWKAFTQLEEIAIVGNPGLRDTPIPPQWAALTQLTHLEVSNSKYDAGVAGFLTGVLPPEWERLTNLATLNLQGQTRLTGALPASWSAMRQLSFLKLDKTQVNGTLPAQWSGMAKLQRLFLQGPGSIEGSLPPSWERMQQLQLIDAPGHRLRGSLPAAWKHLQKLSMIDLSGNLLTGSLPPEWKGLQELSVLKLAHNRLTGPLPPEWKDLNKLVLIELQNNTLTGSLPPEWSDNPNPNPETSSDYILKDFRFNRLAGPFPRGGGFMATANGTLSKTPGMVPDRLCRAEGNSLTVCPLAGVYGASFCGVAPSDCTTCDVGYATATAFASECGPCPAGLTSVGGKPPVECGAPCTGERIALDPVLCGTELARNMSEQAQYDIFAAGGGNVAVPGGLLEDLDTLVDALPEPGAEASDPSNSSTPGGGGSGSGSGISNGNGDSNAATVHVEVATQNGTSLMMLSSIAVAPPPPPGAADPPGARFYASQQARTEIAGEWAYLAPAQLELTTASLVLLGAHASSHPPSCKLGALMALYARPSASLPRLVKNDRSIESVVAGLELVGCLGKALRQASAAAGSQHALSSASNEPLVRLRLPRLPASGAGGEGVSLRCVYWDEDASRWSTAGCSTVAITAHYINCSCTHLSVFAVRAFAFVENPAAEPPIESGSGTMDSVTMGLISGLAAALVLGLAYASWRFKHSTGTQRARGGRCNGLFARLWRRADAAPKLGVMAATGGDTELRFERLKLEQKIGAGGAGQTFKAQYDGHPCCAKELFTQMMQPEEIGELVHEVAMLAQLRHPCIVFYYGWCSEAAVGASMQGRSFILMELGAGTLHDWVHGAQLGHAEGTEARNDSADALLVAALQIAQALAFLHSRHIVHRDVKPQNVILMSMDPDDLVAERVEAKLCDFGISRTYQKRAQMTKAIGTPQYMAPELMRSGIGESYDYSVDVYAFGIVLNQLLSRRMPFEGWDTMKLLKNIDERPEIPAATPKPLKRLVRKCWGAQPEDRPSMRDVAEELSKHVVDMGQRASDNFFELHVSLASSRRPGRESSSSSSPMSDTQEPDRPTALPLGMTDNPMTFPSPMRQSNLTEQGAHL